MFQIKGSCSEMKQGAGIYKNDPNIYVIVVCFLVFLGGGFNARAL